MLDGGTKLAGDEGEVFKSSNLGEDEGVFEEEYLEAFFAVCFTRSEDFWNTLISII